MKGLSAAVMAIGVAITSAQSTALASASRPDRHGHTDVRERPATLDTSPERLSENGLYKVRVQPLQPVRPHRIHDWKLTIEHAGKPVQSAIIVVGGGMPEHGHGYPTTPRAEPVPGGGYLIRGMKFSMRGWWELRLDIRSAAGPDRVTFNVVI